MGSMHDPVLSTNPAEIRFIGRFPTGRGGIILRAFAFVGALLLTPFGIFSGPLPELLLISVSAVLWIIVVVYRLPILRRVRQLQDNSSLQVTSSKISSSIAQERIRNLLIIIGGFFGPMALLYLVEISTWITMLLGVIIGIVGGELLNTLVFRILERRKHVYLCYYVGLSDDGSGLKPESRGIAARKTAN